MNTCQLVGFAGFFRMDKIRNLSVKDVSICSEYMSVLIPKRKNDQYREGHTSLLARSHKATCPVSERFFFFFFFFFYFFFIFNSIWLILSLTIKNAYPTYITYNAVLTLLTIQYDHLRC